MEGTTMTAKRLRGGVLQLALVVCVGILLVPPSSALAACEEAPGLRYPTLDWRSINGGALPQAFRYRLKEDTIDVRIDAGTSQNVAPNEMVVILQSAGSWMWRKEIVAVRVGDTRSSGSILRTDSGSTGPFSMRITRPAGCFVPGGADTIVFRKVDALGWYMRDMYHFDVDHFWSTFGGHIITLTWIDDNHGEPQYPPNYLSP